MKAGFARTIVTLLLTSLPLAVTNSAGAASSPSSTPQTQVWESSPPPGKKDPGRYQERDPRPDRPIAPPAGQRKPVNAQPEPKPDPGRHIIPLPDDRKPMHVQPEPLPWPGRHVIPLPDDRRPHWDGYFFCQVDRWQERQMARIQEGIREGGLTHWEATWLLREQENIRDMERQFRADGRISAWECQVLEDALERAGRHIRQQTRDDDTRYNHYRW